MNQIPDFTVQMRGFDRDQVIQYITRIHHQLGVVEEQLKKSEKFATEASTDRERLTTKVGQLQKTMERKTTEAGSDREQLLAQIAQLQNELKEASGPVESVEGMSERIARMMRTASDEARRTKELAQQEAEVMTRELREQVEAARADRVAASEALTELKASGNARREKILATAMADAEEILQVAREERDRLAKETEEAERSRRELYLRLAEEDEAKRREAQESLDQQIKASWEEDVRNRQEARQRMEQQVAAAWKQADDRIASLDEEARLKASAIIAEAQREAMLLGERTRSGVERLRKERTEILTGLNEIRRWIEAVSDNEADGEQANVIGMPDAPDEAEEAAPVELVEAESR